jgi:molybdate transport system regulatory protein
MKLNLRITITKDSPVPFMGPGPARLLEKIREYHSINLAANSMNLSYVKALKMLNRLEESLDKPLLIRTRGGNNRGGTKITPYGEKYLKNFQKLQKKIKESAQKEFDIFQRQLQEGE